MNRQQIGEMLDKERASKRQEGGSHYRNYSIQPIEYIVANDLGFLAGNVVKYVTRYKDKNGAEDIRKAIHYLELILEFEYSTKVDSQTEVPNDERIRKYQERPDAQRFGQEAWISNHWEGY